MILAGDIGGTKTLLRLEARERGGAACERRYPSREFPDFGAILRAFFSDCRARLGGSFSIEHACLAVAGPVTEGHASVTNLSWRLDAAALAAEFAIGEVALINDFAAAAHGLELLGADELVTLQQGKPVAGAPRLILGPGTGLGIAYVIRQSGERVALAGEAGHAAFAPRDAVQIDLLRWLSARHARVEVEDVVSGRGLEAIYAFLRERKGETPAQRAQPGDAAAIAAAARSGGDATALAAVDLFLSALGAVAGDHALGILARGGVYLTGGIAPKLLWRIPEGGLLPAFNDRGGFSGLSETMPVHVVLNERLGLLGAALLASGEKGG